jgi:uncharacterized protein (DUF433 family)
MPEPNLGYAAGRTAEDELVSAGGGSPSLDAPVDIPAAMETIRDAVTAEIARPAAKRLATRVVSDPEIHDGAPVVAGTHIQTSAIWQFAENGYDADGIIEEYPSLTKLDVAAALAFETQQQNRALAERPVKRAGEIRSAPKGADEMPEIPAFLRRTPAPASPTITATTQTEGRA